MIRKPTGYHPCRCSRCRGRRSFHMNPLDYKVRPTCPCGGYYTLDAYRKRIETKLGRCGCSGYSWSISNGIHKLGSPKCYYMLDGSPKQEPPS